MGKKMYTEAGANVSTNLRQILFWKKALLAVLK